MSESNVLILQCDVVLKNYEMNELYDTILAQKERGVILLPSYVKVVNIFVPSEKTVYKMMVANLATYENIDIAADTIEEAFDHVIDKLVELGDKEK